FSSGSGLNGNSGQANYGAAKAGVAGLTRVVARDLGRYGVTCNAIAPGAATRMTAQAAEQRAALAARTGGDANANRPAAAGARDPELVAPMAAYLASDAAWNVNGQVFYVSGGTVALAWHPVPKKTIYKDGRWTLEELE